MPKLAPRKLISTARDATRRGWRAKKARAVTASYAPVGYGRIVAAVAHRLTKKVAIEDSPLCKFFFMHVLSP